MTEDPRPRLELRLRLRLRSQGSGLGDIQLRDQAQARLRVASTGRRHCRWHHQNRSWDRGLGRSRIQS